jgi:hypothetical protein
MSKDGKYKLSPLTDTQVSDICLALNTINGFNDFDEDKKSFSKFVSGDTETIQIQSLRLIRTSNLNFILCTDTGDSDRIGLDTGNSKTVLYDTNIALFSIRP